jgi:SAM-dependent methyltransferase
MQYTPEQAHQRIESLQKRFDAFCALTDDAKLKIAQELVAQRGTIDSEIEGYASTENQRDLTIRFHWGHDHRFSDSLGVPGMMGNRHIQLIAEFMLGFDLLEDYFTGKSVLDVGCWTGGTSLMLQMLGASRIHGIEEVRKYAATATRLCREVYGMSDFTCDGRSLYSFETEQKFDAVYFPGVIYHLSDPVLALRRLFNACRDGGEILVESAGINSDKPFCMYEGNRVYRGQGSESDMSRSGWNWFVPTTEALRRWIIEAGFNDVKCFYSKTSDRVYGFGRRLRFTEITRAGLSVPEIE